MQKMKNINLAKELDLLKENFILQVQVNKLNVELGKIDQSFKSQNWIITLPFNYYYAIPDADIQIIRKLAVINALYGYYFMIEDDMLDEYHLPTHTYKKLITKYCAAQTLRNLAIGQLIDLCGPDIYGYIYEYENRYYQALFSEKRRSVDKIYGKIVPDILGEKAIPAIIPFAAFCLINNCEYKLDLCEELIGKYHTAHQIYDDLMDIHRDIKKPDKSWLIKYIESEKNEPLTGADQVWRFFKESEFDLDLIEQIQFYLIEARCLNQQLKFVFLAENIRYLQSLVNKYRQRTEMRKSNVDSEKYKISD